MRKKKKKTPTKRKNTYRLVTSTWKTLETNKQKQLGNWNKQKKTLGTNLKLTCNKKPLKAWMVGKLSRFLLGPWIAYFHGSWTWDVWHEIQKIHDRLPTNRLMTFGGQNVGFGGCISTSCNVYFFVEESIVSKKNDQKHVFVCCQVFPSICCWHVYPRCCRSQSFAFRKGTDGPVSRAVFPLPCRSFRF